MTAELSINLQTAMKKSAVPLSPFPLLGREKEVNELISLLSKNQIVTITGTGGIGKTRTAIEIGHLLKHEFQEGVLFISMSTLTEAQEITPHIANALGITESSTRPLGEGVAEYLSNKNMLLILDNLEQISSAAREISEIAANCPKSQILCTSRTPLDIKAEQEYKLHTLPLPAPGSDKSEMESPAIELFTSRAKKVNKDFRLTPENTEAIIEICCCLDGLPLALELAAYRLRVLSPEQLSHRLNKALNILTTGSKDLPERHQTLRATIDWSHSLLEDSEQRLFRRLAVFAKGFSLDAVEAVCYDNEKEAAPALDELESLLNKGLVERLDSNGSFALLQTIRDYALEKLIEKEEFQQISDRHATYYLKRSRFIAGGVSGEYQQDRINQAIHDNANIMAALEFLLDNARSGDMNARESGLRICGELWMVWHIHGKHNTAREFINAFLNCSDDRAPTIGECGALFTLHVASFTLGEIDESLEAAFRLAEAAEKLNDDLAKAKGSFALGFGHMFKDLKVAKKHNNDALDRFTKMNSLVWQGYTLWQKGIFNLASGDLETATESYAAALDIFRKTGDNEGKGCAQSGLALLDFIAGKYDEAIMRYKDAYAAFVAVGDRPEQARILNEISWTCLAQNDAVNALKYTLESIEAHQQVGSTRGIGLSINGLAAICSVMGFPAKAIEIATAANEFAKQKGVAIELGVNNHGKIYLDNARKELTDSEIERAENTGMSYSLQDVLQIIEDEFQASNIKRETDPFLQRLEEAIEANLNDSSFGVNELYEAVSMSQMQVYRKLKSVNGQTPSDVIRNYRLKKGRELLKTTDKTIAEIAYEVGFSDPNYFSRAFRKEFRQSPRSFRK